MDNKLEDMIQESLSEWAEIEKQQAERQKKDRIIISKYCAENAPADIYHTLDLLQKYKGMPKHDKEIVKEFTEKYPEHLDVKIIQAFTDVKDIYSQYLESGGEDNE